MNYAEPHNVNALHMAFRAALAVEEFQYSSDGPVMTTFDALWLQTKAGQGQSKRDSVFLEALNQCLVPIGVIERLPSTLRVSEQGRVWSQVFMVRADGTFEIFGHPIETDVWIALSRALTVFFDELGALLTELSVKLNHWHSPPARVTGLRKAATDFSAPLTFPNPVAPLESYREATVLACRQQLLHLRRRQEELEIRARDRDLLVGIGHDIKCLEAFLATPELADTLTTRKPRLSDYVNIGVLEAERAQRPHVPRTPDEKFGILSAPALFSSDFAAVADDAFARDRSFAVGFIDIDNFKTFNSDHSETIVDQHMLPYFMRALEAYCHGRAIAYRQGGDEYLVLLRNADKDEARAFFDGIRHHIARIPYPEKVTRKPTVSIGVHVIDGNNEVTVFRAKELANAAKNAAKAEINKGKDDGRDRVILTSDMPPDPASNTDAAGADLG